MTTAATRTIKDLLHLLTASDVMASLVDEHFADYYHTPVKVTVIDEYSISVRHGTSGEDDFFLYATYGGHAGCGGLSHSNTSDGDFQILCNAELRSIGDWPAFTDPTGGFQIAAFRRDFKSMLDFFFPKT